MSPRRGSKPRPTDRLVVGRNVTLTLNYVRSIGQGEARHRKYKTLKLGGGQAYDRSSD
jgi:hypothetical protein